MRKIKQLKKPIPDSIMFELSRVPKSKGGDKGTFACQIVSAANGETLWTREKNANEADQEYAIASLITVICSGRFSIVRKGK